MTTEEGLSVREEPWRDVHAHARLAAGPAPRARCAGASVRTGGGQRRLSPTKVTPGGLDPIEL